MPFSTSEVRGSTTRGFAAPATFRLQGLVTLLTAYSPRTRAGLISCRRRSWAFALRSVPLPKGIPHVSARDEPTCRLTCRCSLRRTRGPDRQAPTSGLSPFRKSLATTRAINAAAAGYSLGLRPLPGQPTGRLAHAPAQAPLTRLVAAAALTAGPAPQSLGQHPTRPFSALGPANRADRAALLGFPHRFAPGVRADYQPWLCVHLTGAHPSLGAQHCSLGWSTTLPQPSGPKCGTKRT
jgi:hypothetical protein